MAKPDLKGAIAGLNITKPFDLRQQGKVRFQPPQGEHPQNGDARNRDSQNKDAQSEVPQPEVTRSEDAQNDAATDSSPGASNRKPHGYFRLAHSVFWEPSLRSLSGDAFRIFLWMSSVAWRFDESDGTLRAAVNYIAQATGVSSASVSRCLALLKSEGLIQAREINFRIGNTWWVDPLARGTPPKPGAKDPQSEVPQNQAPRNDAEGSSNRGSTSINSMKQHPQNEDESKNSSRMGKESQTTLSPDAVSPFSGYLDMIQAPRKRERELGALRDLLRNFDPEQIQICLSHLQEHGIPGSGEPCHSPMAFLGSAMDQVLNRAREAQSVREAIDRSLKVAERNRLAEDARHVREDEEVQLEEAKFAQRKAAFVAAFPSYEAQACAVEAFRGRFANVPLRGEGLKNLVIGAWWEERHGTSAVV